jgi:hypothetical protein
MEKPQRKARRIRPKYIKNAQGKTIQVYLDITTYEAILERLKDLDKLKKEKR